MADILTIKEYFKKLQRIVSYEGEFNFFGKTMIKKGKIDDILCCLLASMPETYKKFIKAEYDKKLPSVNSFRLLYKNLRYKALFSSNHYMVDVQYICKLISAINISIEKDINYAENNTPSK